MTAKNVNCVGDLSTEYVQFVEKIDQNCTFFSIDAAVEKWKSNPFDSGETWLFGAPRDIEVMLSGIHDQPGAAWQALGSRQALLSTLDTAGLPHVPFRVARGVEQAEAAVLDLDAEAWVVCSILGRRERAVSSPEEIPLAVRNVTESIPDVPVTVEAVSTGRDMTVQGYVRGGAVHTSCILVHDERPTYHRFPTALSVSPDPPGSAKTSMIRIVEDALSACGLRNSPFSVTLGEFGDGPAVQDLHLCPWWGPSPFDLCKEVYGAGVLEQFLNGRGTIAAPNPGRAAALRWLRIPTGRVESVTGEHEARELPGVIEVRVNVAVGDHVRHMVGTEIRDRTGYVVATGESVGEARDRAVAAAWRIAVVTRNVLAD